MGNTQKSNSWTRRDFMSLLTGIPLAGSFPLGAEAQAPIVAGFPAKNEFEIKGTYINAAYTHPMSKGSFKEVSNFLNERLVNRQVPPGYDGFERTKARNNFARLINASPEEIAWVPSTMVGENLILNGLSLPGSKERVVTDAFHFHGSLHMYGQLAKEGLNVSIVKPRNNRIEISDLDNALKPGTKLLSISLVSATTGFLHNLKEVCDLAHSKGALVYADIIQAAGAIPIDVQASGVDFCASATYKWLMGDFGIGFLYVRKDRLPFLKRTLIGYRQMTNFQSHILPFESPSENLFDSDTTEDMSGHFEVGTFANEGIAALNYSLDYLNRVGVDKIQEYRQPMINRLQQELSSNNQYIPLTPLGSQSPIVCFAYKNAAGILKPKLEAADVNISVYDNMIRISPSFYNDMSDIEKLLSVLKSV